MEVKFLDQSFTSKCPVTHLLQGKLQFGLISRQEFFDKPTRKNPGVAHRPEKPIDPCEENEKTGSRMPQYSYLSRTRDVFGEVGWIPNFEQKKSKFNETRHPAYKEFFDRPRDDYHNEFFTSTSLNDCCDGTETQTLTDIE